MTEQGVLHVISWTLIVMAFVNAYIVWHGWILNRSVNPRSPVLRALLWVKFSIWLLNAYFAIIGFRLIANLEPVMPFGGFGLAAVILFILTVPGVVHSQMQRVLDDES